MIYFDNATTTKPTEKAIAKTLSFLKDKWGVISAPHKKGQELYTPVEEGLKAICQLIGAKESDSFVFTSSGTEAVNHVFQSVYHDVTRLTGKNQFVTSNIDEAASMMSIARLEEYTCVGKMAKADNKGIVSVESILELITPRTALVSLSWANGLTGVINPIADISTICQERGVLFHVDASHVLGKLFFELDDIHPSFLSFNGSHIHAPLGTGGLYVKEGVKFSSMIVGGMDQAGKRAGLYSAGSLAALGVAAAEMVEARDYICTEIARLRDFFEEEITSQIDGAEVFFKDQTRLPHISAISFKGVVNEALLYLLNKRGLYASMGGGNHQQIGLVLMACGVEETKANSALSFAFSKDTTEDEIAKAVFIIKESVSSLRKMSMKFFN